MSKASYKKWKLHAETRIIATYTETGVRNDMGGVPVVVIKDPRGFTWEASAINGRLSSLTLIPWGDQIIDQRALRNIPLGYIEEAALSAVYELDKFLAPVERNGKVYENMTPLDVALDSVGRMPGEIEMRGEPPSLKEFSDAWKKTPQRVIQPDAEGVPELITRRLALARRFYKSIWTIDKWTRAARDAGLISPPIKQNKTKPKTSDDATSDTPKRTEKKMNKKDGENNDR